MLPTTALFRTLTQRLAALAAIAFAALAIVLVTASPAAAATGTSDAGLPASGNPACPDRQEVAKQADRRFTDIKASHALAADIGCVAYYEITTGAGDGTRFAPNDTLTRWQMALFMVRTARQADVTIRSRDMGYSDLGDLSDTVVDGINAAASLGTMPGTSSGNFSPLDSVTRADMAVFLIRLLDLATDNNSPTTVTLDGNTGQVSLSRDGQTVPIDDSFGDLQSASHSELYAINALYELGITRGRRDGSFDPEGTLTRSEMAAFLIRSLGHTEVRPSGPITLRTAETAHLPPDPEGVFEGDPLQLIAHAKVGRAYSLPSDSRTCLMCGYATHPTMVSISPPILTSCIIPRTMLISSPVKSSNVLFLVDFRWMGLPKFQSRRRSGCELCGRLL